MSLLREAGWIAFVAFIVLWTALATGGPYLRFMLLGGALTLVAYIILRLRGLRLPPPD